MMALDDTLLLRIANNKKLDFKKGLLMATNSDLTVERCSLNKHFLLC